MTWQFWNLWIITEEKFPRKPTSKISKPKTINWIPSDGNWDYNVSVFCCIEKLSSSPFWQKLLKKWSFKSMKESYIDFVSSVMSLNIPFAENLSWITPWDLLSIWSCVSEQFFGLSVVVMSSIDAWKNYEAGEKDQLFLFIISISYRAKTDC